MLAAVFRPGQTGPSAASDSGMRIMIPPGSLTGKRRKPGTWIALTSGEERGQAAEEESEEDLPG